MVLRCSEERSEGLLANKALELPGLRPIERGSSLAACVESHHYSVRGRQLNADPLGGGVATQSVSLNRNTGLPRANSTTSGHPTKVSCHGTWIVWFNSRVAYRERRYHSETSESLTTTGFGRSATRRVEKANAPRGVRWSNTSDGSRKRISRSRSSSLRVEP
jgi:hypothetical protein